MIPTGTLSKISSIRNGTFGKSRTQGAAGSGAGGDSSGGKRLGVTEGGVVLGRSTGRIKG